MRNKLIFTFLIGILYLFCSSSVFAADGNVITRHDTVVPEKQMVENVVVIGGSSTIYGSVRDAVIVLNGDLDIKQTARITGVVIVVGGKINQEPGAQLTDNILNITFDEATANSLLIGSAMLIGFWLLQFMLSLFLIVLPVVTTVVARNRLQPFLTIVIGSPIRILVIGMVASLIILALAVLLSLTLIGIPIVVLLLLLTLLTCFLGLTVISQCIGNWIAESTGKPTWLTVSIGAAVIAAGVNIPFVGWILLAGIVWLSMGMVTLWLFEKRQQQR